MEIEKNGKIILFDDDYLELWNMYKWAIDRYVSFPINKKTTYFHRIIMEEELNNFFIKTGKKGYVDHINRNSLDNRKINLRVVSQNDNIMNRYKQNNNTSGYKGINITVNGTYHVALKYNGIRYRKTLPTIYEAIEWRNNKIKELNIFEPK